MGERDGRNPEMMYQNVDLVKMGEVAARLPSFQKKEENAKEAVREAFARCKNPYLAISGGKDSVAMAGLVNEVAKELGRDFAMWAHLSDASFPGTEETIKATAEKLGREVILDWSPVSAFDVVGQGSKKQFGKHGYFFDAIKNFVETEKKDLAFIGVRAYESGRRMKAVRVHGMNFESTVPTYCKICYPLAWYKLEDVAATIVKYSLPIHPIYSKKWVSVYNNAWIRLGYATATDMLNKGTAVFLKLNYPEIYQKLEQAYPEVKNYI